MEPGEAIEDLSLSDLTVHKLQQEERMCIPEGHMFQPRYDYLGVREWPNFGDMASKDGGGFMREPSQRLEHEKLDDVLNAAQRKIYVRDICTRCGKTVERGKDGNAMGGNIKARRYYDYDRE